MAEEMRELSNKTIVMQANINSKDYPKESQGIAVEAFVDGARWFASQLAAGMKAIEEGY